MRRPVTSAAAAGPPQPSSQPGSTEQAEEARLRAELSRLREATHGQGPDRVPSASEVAHEAQLPHWGSSAWRTGELPVPLRAPRPHPPPALPDRPRLIARVALSPPACLLPQVAGAVASPARGLAHSARRALASLGEHISEALDVMRDPEVRREPGRGGGGGVLQAAGRAGAGYYGGAADAPPGCRRRRASQPAIGGVCRSLGPPGGRGGASLRCRQSPRLPCRATPAPQEAASEMAGRVMHHEYGRGYAAPTHQAQPRPEQQQPEQQPEQPKQPADGHNCSQARPAASTPVEGAQGEGEGEGVG
jgi:hypothetical protein